jgi:hypothetical protein
MRNTADETGGNLIAVLKSISGVSAINPLVAFYDIHGGKRGTIVLFYPGHHTRIIIIVSLLMSPLLGHKPPLWTLKENGP